MFASSEKYRGTALGRTALIGLAALVGACASSGSTATTISSTVTSTTAVAVTQPPTGTITVYSGRAEALVKPVFELFTAETGIKVEYRAGDSGELAAQLVTEGSKSPADVFFSQDAGALGALSKAKLAEALPDEVLNRVPTPYRAKDATWVGTSARVRVIIYNPKLVPTPPTAIDQLLEPQWKGKIAYVPTNASWQSFVTGLRVLRGEAGAKKWLEAFAQNSPKAYAGNGAARDAVDSGEIAVGLVNHYYLYEKITKVGADKVTAKNQFLANDPGGLANVAGVAVLKSTGNKAAAEAFVRYLVSNNAQSYFAQQTHEYPVVTGIAGSPLVPSFDSLKPPAIDLSDLDSLAKTQELLASVGLLTK